MEGRRATLALAVCAIAIVGYALLPDRQPVGRGPQPAEPSSLLPGLRAGEVSRLVVQRPGAEIVLTRVARGPWTLPGLGRAADQDDVATLLSLLENEHPAAVDDPPDTAFARSTTLVLTTATGPVRVEVGSVNGPGTATYARIPGAAATFTLPRRLADLVERDAQAWRERRLLAADVTRVSNVRWQFAGGSAVALSRQEAQWFREGRRVARGAVEDLLRCLSDARARALLPLSAGVRDDPPRLLVSIEGDAPWRLEVRDGGCGADEVRVDRQSTAVDSLCVAGEFLGRLQERLARAGRIDARLLAAGPGDVIGIHIASRSARVDLRREPGGWRILEPPGEGPVDGAQVERWLDDLGSLAVEPFEVGTLPRWAGTSLTVDTASGSETVQTGGEAAGWLRVDRQGESAPVGVASGQRGLFAPDPLRFRTRTVLAFPVANLLRMRLEEGRRVTEFTRGPDGGWRLPDGGEAPDSVRRLAALLADLRALRYQPGADFNGTRAVVLDVAGAEGGGYRLDIGADVWGGCRARLAGGQVPLFFLDKETCTALHPVGKSR